MGRTQLGSMILSVSEYFQDFKEQMEQRNRAKITELLDEIESST